MDKRRAEPKGCIHTPSKWRKRQEGRYPHFATTPAGLIFCRFSWRPIPFMVKSTNKIQRYNERLRNMRLFQPQGYGFGILMVLE